MPYPNDDEEEEEELTGEREAQVWVTSFSDLIILSSLKSYGNISVHSLPWQPGGGEVVCVGNLFFKCWRMHSL